MLQEDWAIRRFRPNGVSAGTSARQLDWRVHSPQSSHTAALMKSRFEGRAASPFFLRRRFSDAHICA